ncbi:histone-like nucleoid-structuring protein Lsr2 [Mycolicibacterium fluoranthenivorans]|uniref:histone-like nucleoid-structuring protein Lsr2 n=1 Tax=Mycolicibacterium fluoranthenivorans TaxID=258505 RepID=UPI000B81EEFA|nr:Lsr2 family protein [Mycolicibacterium fluoranthenivorans]
MGKIVTIEYVDDLEGGSISAESVDTVEFSYRGQDYALVLTKRNGAQFDKDISRYITAAKRAQSREARAARQTAKSARRAKDPTSTPTTRRKTSPRKNAAPAASGPERTRAIRQWAADNGHTISTRGRIPAAILQAYDAAH